MTPRSAIGLCAVVVALCGLTACQPPTPRIAGVEAPSYAIVTTNEVVVKTILAASGPAEQAIRIQNLDGLRTHLTTRARLSQAAASRRSDYGRLPRIFLPTLKNARPHLPLLLKTHEVSLTSTFAFRAPVLLNVRAWPS